MQSILDQPKAWPTSTPKSIIEKMIVMVEMMGDAPILRIFLKEKSSPRENSKNITPMSAHRWMFDMSVTEAV